MLDDYGKELSRLIRNATFQIAGKNTKAESWVEVLACMLSVCQKNRQVFIIGNGASATIASHFTD